MMINRDIGERGISHPVDRELIKCIHMESLTGRKRGNFYKCFTFYDGDGYIRLLPGPIILLYHRQTVGGYPRIYQVISADLDKLVQFCPGEHLRFCLVTMDEVFRINRTRSKEVELFRSRFSTK